MTQSMSGKIEKISVVDQVCNKIKEKIISGEYKKGDKLPSESEIAQIYGINRLSVRLALQKLVTLGIIETRVGEGSFVKEFSFYPVLSEMADFVQLGNRINDIKEMRYLLEKESALKAADSCDEEEAGELIVALQRYCSDFDSFYYMPNENNLFSFIDSDLALHMQIVKMSKNLLYLEIYQMIQKLVRLHISTLINQRRKVQESDGIEYKEMHVQLCNAIIAHDRNQTNSILFSLLNIENENEYDF